MWNALSRDTMPHGWPQDVELRPARAVDYEPSSGVLQIGADPDARGKVETIRAVSVERVLVVWIPDYVSKQACPKAASRESVLLVAPRESIRASVVTQGDVSADSPKVVFAAVPVEVGCSALGNPQWIVQHSAKWKPSDEDKRRHRVLRGGAGSAGGIASVAVLSSAAQVDRYYAQRLPGRSILGLTDVDFGSHGVVPLGDGVPRLQYVHPDAVEAERVSNVDVPLTTSACRQRQTGNFSKLVYLADDTGPQPGRYRVEGSPLFVRPKDEPRHELRFADCSTVFARWRPMTTHVQPNPSMYLRLYGPTPGKERKYEDQIVSTPVVTTVGDTLNLSIPLLTSIPCPASVGTKKAVARERTKAHMVRRAVLRRRFELPYHDGPIRLVTPKTHPYDAVEWDIDAKPCSDGAPR